MHGYGCSVIVHIQCSSVCRLAACVGIKHHAVYVNSTLLNCVVGHRLIVMYELTLKHVKYTS